MSRRQSREPNNRVLMKLINLVSEVSFQMWQHPILEAQGT